MNFLQIFALVHYVLTDAQMVMQKRSLAVLHAFVQVIIIIFMHQCSKFDESRKEMNSDNQVIAMIFVN